MPKGLDEKQAERWVRDHWDELIEPNIQTHRLETCGSDLEWHRKCNRLNARATHPEPQGGSACSRTLRRPALPLDQTVQKKKFRD